MTKIFIDTSGLQYYHDSLNNYCHFVLGNLLEIYIVLKKRGLLDDDLQITVNNPRPTYASFYRIFSTHPVKIADHAHEDDLVLQPEGICTWHPSEDKERDEISVYFHEFCAYIIHQLNIKPSKIRQITLIRRNPNQGKRYLINFAQIEKKLQHFCQQHQMKLQCIDFDGLDLVEQVQAMINTSILIGVHGAGIFNCFFLQKGSTLIELIPHAKFKGGKFPFICEKKGVHYIGLRNPIWAIPTLYNLILLVIRKGHRLKEKFYRDRNVLISPTNLIDTVKGMFDYMHHSGTDGTPVSKYIDQTPPDAGVWPNVLLLLQHKKFIMVFGFLAITTIWIQSFGWIPGLVTFLLILSFFF